MWPSPPRTSGSDRPSTVPSGVSRGLNAFSATAVGSNHRRIVANVSSLSPSKKHEQESELKTPPPRRVPSSSSSYRAATAATAAAPGDGGNEKGGENGSPVLPDQEKSLGALSAVELKDILLSGNVQEMLLVARASTEAFSRLAEAHSTLHQAMQTDDGGGGGGGDDDDDDDTQQRRDDRVPKGKPKHSSKSKRRARSRNKSASLASTSNVSNVVVEASHLQNFALTMLKVAHDGKTLSALAAGLLHPFSARTGNRVKDKAMLDKVILHAAVLMHLLLCPPIARAFAFDGGQFANRDNQMAAQESCDLAKQCVARFCQLLDLNLPVVWSYSFAAFLGLCNASSAGREAIVTVGAMKQIAKVTHSVPASFGKNGLCWVFEHLVGALEQLSLQCDDETRAALIRDGAVSVISACIKRWPRGDPMHKTLLRILASMAKGGEQAYAALIDALTPRILSAMRLNVASADFQAFEHVCNFEPSSRRRSSRSQSGRNRDRSRSRSRSRSRGRTAGSAGGPPSTPQRHAQQAAPRRLRALPASPAAANATPAAATTFGRAMPASPSNMSPVSSARAARRK